MALDVEGIRSEFPVTQEYIYMNHAGVAPISESVSGAMERILKDVKRNGMVNSSLWEETYFRTRKSAGKLVGSKASEIAFVKNTTEGILFVANGLKWRAGDNVIITSRGFPANVYPWLNLNSRDIETRWAPEVEGRIPISGIRPGRRMDSTDRSQFG